MTDSDLLDSLLLQRPQPSAAVPDLDFNLNLNERAEPYGPLISFLLAIASILPYVFAVVIAMMKHG